MHTFQSHMVPSYSKNQKGAKEFLKWIHDPKNFDAWFLSQKGFATPTTQVWEKHKMWDEDPVMATFTTSGRQGFTREYAGPANRKATEALAKYIIIDIY